MAYKNQDGEKQYTLKEKIKFHTDCANTGYGIDKDGKKVQLTTAQRVRHGVVAENQKRKLNRFMSKPKSVRDAIVRERKAKSGKTQGT
jgi:hypothetical protein